MCRKKNNLEMLFEKLIATKCNCSHNRLSNGVAQLIKHITKTAPHKMLFHSKK